MCFDVDIIPQLRSQRGRQFVKMLSISVRLCSETSFTDIVTAENTIIHGSAGWASIFAGVEDRKTNIFLWSLMAVLGPLSSLLFSSGHLLFFSGKLENGGESLVSRQITWELLKFSGKKENTPCGGGEERKENTQCKWRWMWQKENSREED